MRAVFVVAGLFALMLAELPVINAQSADDDADDDGSEGDPIKAMKLAQKQADSEPAPEEQGPAGPAEPVEQQLPSLPAAPQEEKEAAPAELEHVVPATVSMASATSLNHFGQQQGAGPAPAPAAAMEEKVVKEVLTKEESVAVDAKNAHTAAETAKQAAEVANQVATHSVKLVGGAKSALKDAQDAIHKARVDTKGLSDKQKHSLKDAESKLKEATKKADYGQVKNAKYIKAEVEHKKLQKLEKKMDKLKKEDKKKEPKDKSKDELEAMRKEIDELRKELKKKEGDKDDSDAMLKELQESIKEMEKDDKKEDGATKKSHDEMKSEIERLRAEIQDMQDDQGKVTYTIPAKEEKPAEKVVAEKVVKKEEKQEEKEETVEKYNVRRNMEPLSQDEQGEEEVQDRREAAPVESKGLDIDTAMPYGDLEPFGREDTAQELTEASIKESDEMVDTIEKAEVAEEKRSVFRALTRLRGAAITSFDGVARSQSGNIDEFNKIHKWRNTHPIHHLADEESDVSKWAFPDNAD